MSIKDFKSIADFKGLMNQAQVSDPEVYGRANYIRILKKG
jgi:hypothetical protein